MTEERRLVAEEGSFSKKTWLPKIHCVLASSIWAQYIYLVTVDKFVWGIVFSGINLLMFAPLLL